MYKVKSRTSQEFNTPAPAQITPLTDAQKTKILDAAKKVRTEINQASENFKNIDSTLDSHEKIHAGFNATFAKHSDSISFNAQQVDSLHDFMHGNHSTALAGNTTDSE